MAEKRERHQFNFEFPVDLRGPAENYATDHEMTTGAVVRLAVRKFLESEGLVRGPGRDRRVIRPKS